MSEREFPPHTLERAGDTWWCSVCGWRWPKPPSTDCPGIARFAWYDQVPSFLDTASALRRRGLKPSGNVAGFLYEQGGAVVAWLFDVREATPRRPMPPAQRAALQRGRLTQARERQGRPPDDPV